MSELIMHSEDRLVNMLLTLRCDIKDAIRRQEKWIKEEKTKTYCSGIKAQRQCWKWY